MSEQILVECDCAPEYSHHCYKCGGTGLRPAPIPEKGTTMLKTGTNDPFLRLDSQAKIYAHLDEEEIQAIAKAVCDEMYRREYESKMKIVFTGDET